jgi:hypothetical protein
MKPETKRILLDADEQGQYEFPKHFDSKSIEQRAKTVHTEIVTAGYEARFEDWVENQDASFGLAITIDAFGKRMNGMICIPTIRFSNFGNLASLTWQNHVDDQFLSLLIATLANQQFTFIPEADLAEPYDGINAPVEAFPTWWARYFDWL